MAREQLLTLGLGSGAIEHRLRCGRLHRVHRGVHALVNRVLTNEGRWMAAVLAAGPSAVLSHRSAADLWGIGPFARRRREVTVGVRRRAGPDVEVHRAALQEDELTERRGIPVTTASRTATLRSVPASGRIGDGITRGEFEERFLARSRPTARGIGPSTPPDGGVVRVTWRQLDSEATSLAADLRRVLAHAGDADPHTVRGPAR